MKIFIMQRVTAVALIFFMTLHMVVVHFFPVRHLDYQEVWMNRMGHPGWKLMYVLFLMAVLVHGMTGAYMVLTDVEKIATYKKGLAWGAIVVGVIYFIYGTMTVLSFPAA